MTDHEILAIAETKFHIKGQGREVFGRQDIVDFARAMMAAATSAPEPVMWRFIGIGGLKRVLTDKQYQGQTPSVRRWYEPMCAKCSIKP